MHAPSTRNASHQNIVSIDNVTKVSTEIHVKTTMTVIQEDVWDS